MAVSCTSTGGSLVSASTLSLPAVGPFTVSVWVRSPSGTAWAAKTSMVSLYGSGTSSAVQLGCFSANTLGVWNNAGTALVTSTGYTPPSGSWIHLLVSSDGSTFSKLYINGVLNNTSSTLNSAGTLTQAVVNGSPDLSGTNKGNFQAEDFQVFNRVLSDNEIRTLYNAGANRSAILNGCVVRYPFNEVLPSSISAPVVTPGGQGRNSGGPNVITVPVTVTNSGDTVVVAVAIVDSVTRVTSSVTGIAGVTFTKAAETGVIVTDATFQGSSSIWIATNVPSGTYTLTVTPGTGYSDVYAEVYSCTITPSKQLGTGASVLGSAKPMSTGAITAPPLAIVFTAMNYSSNIQSEVFTSPPAGWTRLRAQTDTFTYAGLVFDYYVSTEETSVNNTFTANGTANWGSCFVSIVPQDVQSISSTKSLTATPAAMTPSGTAPSYYPTAITQNRRAQT